MSTWHLPRITLADAENEPAHERLSFERRPPSPATREALRRAEQPSLLAEDVVLMQAKRRPGQVG
jgi:hypothetical protein